MIQMFNDDDHDKSMRWEKSDPKKDYRDHVFECILEEAQDNLACIEAAIEGVKKSYKEFPRLAQPIGFMEAAKDALNMAIESLKKEMDN